MFIYMCVQKHACDVTRAGVTKSFGFWELNLGSLQGQRLLLTRAIAPASKCMYFKLT